MTRKEKELKMLETLGLKVGDKIKACYVIYEIVEEEEFHILHPVDNGVSELVNVGSIAHVLLDYDWKKIKSSIKDKKCKDFDRCIGCPIYKSDYLDCGNGEEETLEEKYNKANQDLNKLKTEIFGDEK